MPEHNEPAGRFSAKVLPDSIHSFHRKSVYQMKKGKYMLKIPRKIYLYSRDVSIEVGHTTMFLIALVFWKIQKVHITTNRIMSLNCKDFQRMLVFFSQTS